MESLQDFLVLECKDNETRNFARQLIDGTRRELSNIDALLARVARNWDLKRMAVIDRNVLRMAVHELFSCHDIPPKVTINEAIELGKKFSTINSGAFINGILDRVHLDHLDASGRITAGLKASADLAEQSAEAEVQAEEGPALSS
jgi:transcription antitermination factor NusB